MKSASILAVILALVYCFSGVAIAQAQTPETHTVSPGSSGETLTANKIMAQPGSQPGSTQAVHLPSADPCRAEPNERQLVRQEDTDYRVVPQADKTERKLGKITGKYWKKGKYEQFSGEPTPDPDHLDAELVNDMREDSVEPKSKDGIGHNLVPFSSEKLKKHVFKLEGRETFHWQFAPRWGLTSRASGTAYGVRNSPAVFGFRSLTDRNSPFTFCSFTTAK